MMRSQMICLALALYSLFPLLISLSKVAMLSSYIALRSLDPHTPYRSAVAPSQNPGIYHDPAVWVDWRAQPSPGPYFTLRQRRFSSTSAAIVVVRFAVSIRLKVLFLDTNHEYLINPSQIVTLSCVGCCVDTI
ncbi:hypothetical protein F5Y09DRAFT_78782 [Xylaria sp. FL1042]|nr:hypothetical protein F5Y09DRAFT_78782 [Xylaria sp. FL1042]